MLLILSLVLQHDRFAGLSRMEMIEVDSER